MHRCYLPSPDPSNFRVVVQHDSLWIIGAHRREPADAFRGSVLRTPATFAVVHMAHLGSSIPTEAKLLSQELPCGLWSLMLCLREEETLLLLMVFMHNSIVNADVFFVNEDYQGMFAQVRSMSYCMSCASASTKRTRGDC